MQVEMEHRLSSDTAVIGKHVEALEREARYHRAGDNLGRGHQFGQVTGGHRQKVPAMGLWDHECVAVVDRVDIQNGNDPLCFIQDFGGKFSADDAAEGTVFPAGPVVRWFVQGGLRSPSWLCKSLKSTKFLPENQRYLRCISEGCSLYWYVFSASPLPPRSKHETVFSHRYP